MKELFETNNNDNFLLKKFSFDVLSDAELEALNDVSADVYFNKKEIIFRQGTLSSHVFFVKSGLAKTYKEAKNKKILTFQIAAPGDFLGMLAVFGHTKYQYSASAIMPCEIIQIDIHSFRNIIEKNGKYGLNIIDLISQNGLFLSERLMSQYQKQLPGKVAELLLYFSEHIYNSTKFQLPLSRRELAELAGTTKESLIRTLTEFKNDRIIILDNKTVKIRSMEILKVLSKIG